MAIFLLFKALYICDFLISLYKYTAHQKKKKKKSAPDFN